MRALAPRIVACFVLGALTLAVAQASAEPALLDDREVHRRLARVDEDLVESQAVLDDVGPGPVRDAAQDALVALDEALRVARVALAGTAVTPTGVVVDLAAQQDAVDAFFAAFDDYEAAVQNAGLPQPAAKKLPRLAFRMRSNLEGLRSTLAAATPATGIQAPMVAPAPGANGQAPSAVALSEADFDLLVKTVGDAPYAAGKLGVLADAAPRHVFEVGQVIRLLQLFDYGTDRVDAAVLLYPRLSDTEGWLKVEEELFVYAEDRLRVVQLAESTTKNK